MTALHIFRMSYKGKNPGRSNLIFHAIDWMKVSYWLHVCICHLREKIPVKFHFDVDFNMNLSRLLLAIETRKSSFELVREGILETSWIICICPDSFCGRSVSLIEEEIKIEWDFIFWTLIIRPFKNPISIYMFLHEPHISRINIWWFILKMSRWDKSDLRQRGRNCALHTE